MVFVTCASVPGPVLAAFMLSASLSAVPALADSSLAVVISVTEACASMSGAGASSAGFAAIPAVIAYNRFANDVERLSNRYDTFMEEFSTILQRQVHD